MKGPWPIVAILVFGFGNLALSQDQVVDRAAQGQAGKDIRVGVYANVKPDCTSGPLPAIRLSSAPAHGKVTVKKAKINATNFKECLALEVPGYVAFYKSQTDFSGSDVFVLEVKFPGGKTEIQRITVTVASPGSGKGAERCHQRDQETAVVLQYRVVPDMGHAAAHHGENQHQVERDEDIPADEVTLERSLYKALHELQRLQAARDGQAVPLPVVVDVR